LEPNRIYLDYNATTPIAPEVAEAMRPLLSEAFGNPSSSHWAGFPARHALERARDQVADLLGCASSEVVFTSGGSESNNAAIKGAWFQLRERGDHIVTTRVEHPAVMEPCRWLEGLGARVSYVPVDGTGRVDPDDIRKVLTRRTVLVTVMHANNEVGTIQPIEDISKICREAGVLLHTDAAQSVGKIPTRVDELGVDLLTVAGHKLYAPKGIGALYLRRATPLTPLIHGAGHEGGRRAGTESALLAVGLGAACQLARGDLGTARVRELRDRLWLGLQEIFGPRVVRNGHPEHCLPNTLHVSFLGRTGAEVLAALPGVAASTGSACHAGAVRISPVLSAMGVSPEGGAGAVRWSLGRFTTREEIDTVLRGLRALRGAPPSPGCSEL
jgi:cysteine desulfurase